MQALFFFAHKILYLIHAILLAPNLDHFKKICIHVLTKKSFINYIHYNNSPIPKTHHKKHRSEGGNHFGEFSVRVNEQQSNADVKNGKYNKTDF
ncbi:hypothetical protein BB776_00815 [Planococcus salinarum]|uniref:Secreted protein n=1 Tax=Planococcus salinarum TaxID=622695 RepID=A0ABX3D057_9BACL|nr:hypothetical protein BB776_00815 [Planococcus salinarum]